MSSIIFPLMYDIDMSSISYKSYTINCNPLPVVTLNENESIKLFLIICRLPVSHTNIFPFLSTELVAP